MGPKHCRKYFLVSKQQFNFFLFNFTQKLKKRTMKSWSELERGGVFSKAFRLSLERSKRKKNIAGIAKAALHNLLSVWPKYVHIELLVQQKSKKPFFAWVSYWNSFLRLFSKTEQRNWDLSTFQPMYCIDIQQDRTMGFFESQIIWGEQIQFLNSSVELKNLIEYCKSNK